MCVTEYSREYILIRYHIPIIVHDADVIWEGGGYRHRQCRYNKILVTATVY